MSPLHIRAHINRILYKITHPKPRKRKSFRWPFYSSRKERPPHEEARLDLLTRAANSHGPPTRFTTPQPPQSSPEKRLLVFRPAYLRTHTINESCGYEMVADKLEILKRKQSNGACIYSPKKMHFVD